MWYSAMMGPSSISASEFGGIRSDIRNEACVAMRIQEANDKNALNKQEINITSLTFQYVDIKSSCAVFVALSTPPPPPEELELFELSAVEVASASNVFSSATAVIMMADARNDPPIDKLRNVCTPNISAPFMPSVIILRTQRVLSIKFTPNDTRSGWRSSSTK